MPTLEVYKRINKNKGLTNGQRRKYESDRIMEETWNEDIQAKTGYIYDYYHDDEKLIYKGLSPEDSLTKIPIDVKYIQVGYNSEAKDIQGYHIQFKPSVIANHPVYYYDKDYAIPYGADFPVGLFIDLFDQNIKTWRKWIIAEPGYDLGLQFPTWYILPCDHVFQWIHKGKKMQMCGTLRAQSSYNAGRWSEYRMTFVENQRKVILPFNDISSTIYYDKRMIISEPIDEPITWECSKVENTQPKGIQRLTFAQGKFDQFKDYIEKDSQGNVIGMWADYYSEPVQEDIQKPDDEEQIYSSISYSGTKSQIKIGGSYKTFTVNFFKGDTQVDPVDGSWTFTVDGKPVDKLIEMQTVSSNQIKIKFIGDDDYLYKTLVLSHTTNKGNINSKLDIEIVGL